MASNAQKMSSEHDELKQAILENFPSGLKFVMAYGSKVVPQHGYSTEQAKMTDLIFVVEDPEQWHRENIKCNKNHYSALRLLGAPTLAKIQEWAAGFYFNTGVNVKNFYVKYGVISLDRFVDDLTHWQSLYAAGRLHKPVEVLQTCQKIDDAQLRNLDAAFSAALLLLPQKFTERELFMTIAGLSYTGDIRMKFAEHPDKVKNLVISNEERFRALYADLIEENCGPSSDEPENENDILFEQDMDPVKRAALCASLPSTLREAMLRQFHTLSQSSASSVTSATSTDTPSTVVQQSKSSVQVSVSSPATNTASSSTLPSSSSSSSCSSSSSSVSSSSSISFSSSSSCSSSSSSPSVSSSSPSVSPSISHSSIRHKLTRRTPPDRLLKDVDRMDMWRQLIDSGPDITRNTVRTGISTIVSRSSRAQTIKNAFTTGLFKSLIYLFRKIGKKFRM
eukprot:TRINITY_DN2243_c0_g1_i1.p1 TRINITY_DN2243_c0_g1~~TRINITY_DN2243_c0_g1_i1.p1  ORF type:complete len:464 (-),score=114.30 TRINITY_DN2243_c0_g1_i1:526-1875(-)